MDIKKLIFFITAAACLSCEKVEVDWAPVELSIKVADSTGVDLLNPTSPNNCVTGSSITFRGEKYDLVDATSGNNSTTDTKACKPAMYGFRLVRDAATVGLSFGYELVTDNTWKSSSTSVSTPLKTNYTLKFGEIDGAADLDEDLVITWSDGSTDTIHYHCSNHREKPSPECSRYFSIGSTKSEAGNLYLIR